MGLDKFLHKFNVLKQKGVDIQCVLDIGAYKGEFTKLIKSIYPNALIEMFEPNENHSSILNNITSSLKDVRYNNSLLSDFIKEIDFYSIPESNGIVSTGSSVYLEDTVFYKNPIVTRKLTSTLDNWFNQSRQTLQSFNWKEQGLIKLDVQGSELDVLKGAHSFIKECKPKYYLMEVSVQQYNHGSPLIGDVFDYMNSFAKMVDVFDTACDSYGFAFQMDILFESK